MHELSVTQSMLDIVLEQAKRAEARRVARINLIIGEMTGVVGDSVSFYLDILSKGTIAEGAAVNIKSIPATAKCRKCGSIFELGEHDWTCPACQGDSFEIVGGPELFVDSIEVE
ncbi:MAG: hydrogenase maturation nickel metallochaperone HypA [Chloroflexi bacterium]|nr:hydrogenase maturation nickel metallochaperone HypA [Chloroflexota bacterium]